MPRSRPPYPPEFREQIIALVRAGRTPEELAREFEPSAQTIRNWTKQADLDQGLRKDGLTTEERSELRRLKRENKQLRMEREILKKAAAWFARESNSIPDRGAAESGAGLTAGKLASKARSPASYALNVRQRRERGGSNQAIDHGPQEVPPV